MSAKKSVQLAVIASFFLVIAVFLVLVGLGLQPRLYLDPRAAYFAKYPDLAAQNCIVALSPETVTQDYWLADTGGTVISAIFDEALWTKLETLSVDYGGIILKDCATFLVVGQSGQLWPVAIASLTGIDLSGSSSDRPHAQNADLQGITMGYRLLVIANPDNTLTVRQVSSLYMHRNERETVGNPTDTQEWVINPA